MENYIVVGILVVIAAGIILYLVKQKKKGVKCVGCPHAKQCGGNCSNNCNHTKNHQM
ncbi:MAG: FeoB-associated Cys-rich membrane protein [Acutalibacteraceae bacterium]|nr:FeoB-associated Cys-rich membrane protein [Acutalibacteraceae bacterium]